MEKVHATLGQGGGLLGEGIDHRTLLNLTHGEKLAAGAEDAGHQHVVASSFAGQASGDQVHLPRAVPQPVGIQSQSVGVKRVGLDDLRPGVNVLSVHLPDGLGRQEVQPLTGVALGSVDRGQTGR